MYQSYNDFIARKTRQYGAQFDPSDLCPQFMHDYETGQRIEVLSPYGDTLRGYVGVTTGWKPAWLLLPRCDSISSCVLLNTEYTITKRLPLYREK